VKTQTSSLLGSADITTTISGDLWYTGKTIPATNALTSDVQLWNFKKKPTPLAGILGKHFSVFVVLRNFGCGVCTEGKDQQYGEGERQREREKEVNGKGGTEGWEKGKKEIGRRGTRNKGEGGIRKSHFSDSTRPFNAKSFWWPRKKNFSDSGQASWSSDEDRGRCTTIG
jgi:hypothetical protein